MRVNIAFKHCIYNPLGLIFRIDTQYKIFDYLQMRFFQNPTITLGQLTQKISDKKKQVHFLQRVGVIPRSIQCTKCQLPVTNIDCSDKNGTPTFRCSKCSRRRSVRTSTFMSNSKLSLRRIIILGIIMTVDFWELYCLCKAVCKADFISTNVCPSVSGRFRILIEKQHNQAVIT